MTVTCPTCNLPVIRATLPGGDPVMLRPRRSPRGEIAAKETGGTWSARVLLADPSLKPGEDRYHPHECKGRSGGLEAVRKAQAADAHRQRTARGRYPRSKPVIGVRIPPPGGER